MGKIFNEKWEIITNFDAGGQSDIFQVKNIETQCSEFVLKRIRNPKRRERFKTEVNACKILNHPNVIKLVDHSAFEATDDTKMFLVMPLLTGGNLKKRVSAFKNSIDSTLQVAKQVAQGLEAAHLKGIIHRDIKPENIIFNNEGLECVIADFGIAIIRENLIRSTEEGEIVGPRSFLAPELEDGGVLDVEPSVDIYSLGKLIYFMISGGVILPREQHRDPKYNLFNSSGMRLKLLGLLLDRMICIKEPRIKNISEVIDKLDNIIEWDQREGPQIKAPIFNSIESMIHEDKHNLEIQEHNSKIRELNAQNLNVFFQSSSPWLNDYVKSFPSILTVPDFFEVSIIDSNKITLENFTLGRTSDIFQPISAIGLKIKRPKEIFNKDHSLYFFLGHIRDEILFYNPHVKSKPRDHKILLLPFYFKDINWKGFIRKNDNPIIYKSYIGPPVNICVQHSISDWPENVHEYQSCIQDSIQNVFQYIKDGANSLGN